jgi:hypothetical protein
MASTAVLAGVVGSERTTLVGKSSLSLPLDWFFSLSDLASCSFYRCFFDLDPSPFRGPILQSSFLSPSTRRLENFLPQTFGTLWWTSRTELFKLQDA